MHMKIAAIEVIPLRIPYTYGARRAVGGGQHIPALDYVLLRVETDQGLVGWGEAFAYNSRDAVAAATRSMVAPRAIGADVADIAGLTRRLQQELHIFGRYGITMHAISGLDIALWDIAGKLAGRPLVALLGGGGRTSLAAYASLYKYADAEAVAARAAQAMQEGYGQIKLHETAIAEVARVRETIGPDVPLMLDTNCPWTPEEARRMARLLAPFDLHWLEEPIFPPEDFVALAALGRASGIPIAAGENACTAFQFQAMFDAGAVAYAQPSVTKVGGITEFLKVAALAETHGVALAPHSPYFGPGLLATLQLAAARPIETVVEVFHLDREACLFGAATMPARGRLPVPAGPGLGLDPDPDVIKTYRVAEA